MALVHSKNTIGILQGPTGKHITSLIRSYEFGGIGGTQDVNRKGKDITEVIRSQGQVSIDFRGYFESSDVPYMVMQAFMDNLPITFSAIQLTKKAARSPEGFHILASEQGEQIIDEGFQNPTGDTKGILFRAFGFLDECKIIADAGEFVLIRGVLKATEFVPGRLLL